MKFSTCLNKSNGYALFELWQCSFNAREFDTLEASKNCTLKFIIRKDSVSKEPLSCPIDCEMSLTRVVHTLFNKTPILPNHVPFEFPWYFVANFHDDPPSLLASRIKDHRERNELDQTHLALQRTRLLSYLVSFPPFTRPTTRRNSIHGSGNSIRPWIAGKYQSSRNPHTRFPAPAN